MTETTIPQINIIALMERIRAKAESIRRLQAVPKLPPVGELAPLPSVILPKAVLPKTEQIMEATHRARQAIAVGRWIPKPLRRLFQREDKFDREMLRAIEWLTQSNAQLADRLRHLTACVEVQDHSLHQLAEVRLDDRGWMNGVSQFVATTNRRFADIRADLQNDIDSKLQQQMERFGPLTEQSRIFETALQEESRTTRDRLAQLSVSLEQLGAQVKSAIQAAEQTANESEQAANRVAQLEHQSVASHAQLTDLTHRLDQFEQKTGTLNEHLAGMRGSVEQLEEKSQLLSNHLTTIGRHGEQLAIQTNNMHTEHNALTEIARASRADLDQANEHLQSLRAETARLSEVATEFQRDLALRVEEHSHLAHQLQGESTERGAIRRDFELLEQRHTSDSAFLKAELALQSRLVHTFIERLSRRKSGTRLSATPSESPATHRFDAFYLTFEDRFRGSRDQIKGKQRFYLPYLGKCGAGGDRRPIVDLGCGRGEWLELLRENKLIATGVDSNETMISQCKERALNVVQSDALEFLRGLPDCSQGAITGFHIIEHLPLETLLGLVVEANRVLVPGGIAIFESPNCKNLIVGACNFYADPTHRNPVFPETAEFMLTTYGFDQVRLEFLSPVKVDLFSEGNSESELLRELLYGPQDFAVIGYKPAADAVKALPAH